MRVWSPIFPCRTEGWECENTSSALWQTSCFRLKMPHPRSEKNVKARVWSFCGVFSLHSFPRDTWLRKKNRSRVPPDDCFEFISDAFGIFLIAAAQCCTLFYFRISLGFMRTGPDGTHEWSLMCVCCLCLFLWVCRDRLLTKSGSDRLITLGTDLVRDYVDFVGSVNMVDGIVKSKAS